MADAKQERFDAVMTGNEERAAENEENSSGLIDSGQPSLEEQLAEKSRLLDEMLDKSKRLQAEFDNFRKRTVKEKEDISAIVTERIISGLLPVMDNFERAIESSSGNAASLAAGVEMIFRQFNSVLAKLGVEQIQALDCQFDPAQHEAVMMVSDSDKPEGVIISEIQKGYKLNERVIRASMVKVSSG